MYKNLFKKTIGLDCKVSSPKTFDSFINCCRRKTKRKSIRLGQFLNFKRESNEILYKSEN